jgi:hypothetical protein
MTMQRQFESRSSGPRWNQIVERMVARFEQRVKFFEELFLADGYPPFTEPLSPLQQYQRLVSWRQAGDPRFWNSAPAQEALDALSLQYGAPPPISPLTGQTPPRLI